MDRGNKMIRIVVLLLSFISICLQHIIHEYAHVIAAFFLGEKVKKIQWLTYQGGTRVFFENEPDYDTQVERKWAIIAGAGYITTNFLGYVLVIIHLITTNNMLKAVLCLPAIMFLTIDCIYFVLGSMGNFGDIIGIRKVLHIPKSLSIIVSYFVLIVNLIIINAVFY